MIKRRKKSAAPLMRRACRVYLNDVNTGKASTVRAFLHRCRDMTQYAVDLFWQCRDFNATLADLPTVHRIRDRFGATTRLSQAIAKQAKEMLRSGKAKGFRRKPRLRRHAVTLYSHFVRLEAFHGAAFDYAAVLTGSGAPKGLTLPFRSTRLINRRLRDGWRMDRTIRLGRTGKRLWIDVMLVKERPPKPQWNRPRIVGMDSNYKAGFVFSDGQQVGREIYEVIQTFGKRRKHTHAYVKALVGAALKKVDWNRIDVLVLERLRHVKHGKRGTFPRRLNRRLSHWLYRVSESLIAQYCDEHGIRLVYKSPWKTSQCCNQCLAWDRRNRQGDRFQCVSCGHVDHADFNAAKNLKLLAMVGVYGLGKPQKQPSCLKRHDFC